VTANLDGVPDDLPVDPAPLESPDPAQPLDTAQPPESAKPAPRLTAGRSLRLFWIYTVARFGVAAVLYLVLWLFGLGGLLGVAVAIVVSIPLSYVLLAKPRAALAENIEQRVNAHRLHQEDLTRKLTGDDA
jgi:hypothetical protein